MRYLTRGFSLVECLFCIVIVALALTVGLRVLQQVTYQRHLAALRADLSQLWLSLGNYYDRIGCEGGHDVHNIGVFAGSLTPSWSELADGNDLVAQLAEGRVPWVSSYELMVEEQVVEDGAEPEERKPHYHHWLVVRAVLRGRSVAQLQALGRRLSATEVDAATGSLVWKKPAFLVVGRDVGIYNPAAASQVGAADELMQGVASETSRLYCDL